MALQVAVYPGTYDPITLGHMSIVEVASRMFDKVVIAVAGSESKKPLFGIDQRCSLIKESISEAGLSNIEVIAYDRKLTIHLAREVGATYMVRGLRAVSDFEYELQLAEMNRSLDAGLETVFLTSPTEHSYISSTLVREISMLGGDPTKFVPKCVGQALADLHKPS